MNEKPNWWPECPYPEDIFPMTSEEFQQAIPDAYLRTAVAGYLARRVWNIASDAIWDRFQEHKKKEEG